MRGLALIAACCALGAGATSAASSPTLAHCRASQLKLTGSLQGATQSLLGTLDLVNRSGRACALPSAPSRVTLHVGTQVLPALTVPMNRHLWPPGVPTRKLAAHKRVFVGIQWRNWCGRPRGTVRLSVTLTIYPNVSPRAPVGRVSTPQCVDNKHSSRVAVSRFMVST